MIRFSSLSQSLYVHNKIGCTSENNIFKMCFNADNFLSGLFVVCLIYKKKNITNREKYVVVTVEHQI